MYRSETWDMTQRWTRQNLAERTEIRMVRWMMGIKRIEKMRTEDIRARVGVANRDENGEMDDGNKED